jgi:hypothetical protein
MRIKDRRRREEEEEEEEEAGDEGKERICR